MTSTISGSRGSPNCRQKEQNRLISVQRWTLLWTLGCEKFLPGLAWLLLSKTGSLFSPSLYKDFFQWSFFDELAPVVAIIRSVMVLKLKQPCKVPSIEMDKKVDLFN